MTDEASVAGAPCENCGTIDIGGSMTRRKRNYGRFWCCTCIDEWFESGGDRQGVPADD